MKILFILDLYPPHIWWVEILFENIILGLEKQEVECTILTSCYDTNLPRYEVISKNIEIYRVGHNRYDFMFFALFAWYRLAKTSDIIHTTTYNSAIVASIIGYISWKKVVLTVHEIFGKLWYRFMGWKWSFFKLFERCIFLFPFERYICVSHYTKNSLRLHFGISDKKLTTVYNAIDYNFWNSENVLKADIKSIQENVFPKEKYIGLFYGRSWISKWLEFYVQAIPRILEILPNFHAFLILPESKNNPSNHIKTLISKLQIESAVTIHPAVKNTKLREYILASDLVIIPSLAEGFGFAVAEVSALWHNLVTTNIAAIPEVASGNIIFVEPWNPKQIAQAVYDFSQGNFETSPLKKFYWEDTLSQLQHIYKEVVWK